jgi:1-acyl-sn-glycerol-3-phosphate acyltransferase
MHTANAGSHSSVSETIPEPHGRSAAMHGRNWARIAWCYSVQLLSLGIFFGLGVVANGLVWVAARSGRASDPRGGQAWIHRLFRFFTWWVEVSGMVRVQYRGLEKLADLRGCVIAPNHPGILDAVFVVAQMPRAVCVMRASLMRNPAMGSIARYAGYITNDIGPGLIREARDKLRAGENVLIFPEGTRTRAHAQGVNDLKSGFALVATLTGAPIQTVLIERSGQYLSKEIGLLSAAKIPIVVTLTLGEVFRAKPGESAKQLAKRLEVYFQARLENTEEGVRIRK